MPRITLVKTNFTQGEVSEKLLGRSDLQAFANGARKMSNVHVFPTGGTTRRAGLRYVDDLSILKDDDTRQSFDYGRVVSFEFNTEKTYILVFVDMKLLIYRPLEAYQDDDLSQNIEPEVLDAFWTKDQLKQITWTQSADELLICHPDVAPKRLIRHSDTNFSLNDWEFYSSGGKVFAPYHKYEADEIALEPLTSSGNNVQVNATGADGKPALIFNDGHIGSRIRMHNGEAIIKSVPDASYVYVDIKSNLNSDAKTTDWEEIAFSAYRGWPKSVCFHQDRLVIGGSKGLPNRLWMSKSSDLYNFDLGEGLDDEAIEFAILSDQVNAIQGVFSGRHLQVFTSGAEWMVTGDPLTPENIQLNRQTRIGSITSHSVPPRDVDGATLFASRNGMELREFLFADVEQAYQSNDLATLSRHLMKFPVDQDFEKSRRLMHIVMADGTMSVVTLYRQEKVTAWTSFETDGDFISVAVVGTDIYCIIDRESHVTLEKFDADYYTDSGRIYHEKMAQEAYFAGGLEHLNNAAVQIVVNGIYQGTKKVQNGGVLIGSIPTNSKIEVGLPFTHEVIPLPIYQQGGNSAGFGKPIRLVRATFRLHESKALQVDTGQGPKIQSFRRLGSTELLDKETEDFTGDKTVRSLGWIRGDARALWHVHQDDPMPCTILSVATEVSIMGQ
ncbi:hypothetical protein [Curvivirga aplysinae]|uniref:hypothetical protein n=1 Tax=Curvivirga aplysinae TaxID=2529852 RepID=UPI0012BCE194|nr:hypothetical protein [Curvivirga aplysinae]MTI08488.1 hypothetical protein [Curvivirga aplysinae]